MQNPGEARTVFVYSVFRVNLPYRTKEMLVKASTPKTNIPKPSVKPIVPNPAGRRNLLWRIEALEEKSLSGWQVQMVADARRAMDGGRYPEGEVIMMKAERPDLWDPIG